MDAPFYVRWLQEAPDALDRVIQRIQAKRDEIRADETLSTQGRSQALAALRPWADRQVADVVERALEAQESAQRHITQALKPPTDPSERLLRAQDEARAWERVRRLLDSGVPPSELIARAGEAGDVATLRALRVELSPWLEATTAADAPPLHRESARRTARERAEALTEAIDRAEAPHLPNRQREALEMRFQVRALGDVVKTKQALVESVLSERNVGTAYIRAGLAANDAERGLMEASATSESRAS